MLSKKVQVEALWGNIHESPGLTFFHSKQRQAPMHTAPSVFLLYSSIYFVSSLMHLHYRRLMEPYNALLLFPGYP
jgi:hypothetical protein